MVDQTSLLVYKPTLAVLFHSVRPTAERQSSHDVACLLYTPLRQQSQSTKSARNGCFSNFPLLDTTFTLRLYCTKRGRPRQGRLPDAKDLHYPGGNAPSAADFHLTDWTAVASPVHSGQAVRRGGLMP
jgi:hypothetical protein